MASRLRPQDAPQKHLSQVSEREWRMSCCGYCMISPTHSLHVDIFETNNTFMYTINTLADMCAAAGHTERLAGVSCCRVSMWHHMMPDTLSVSHTLAEHLPDTLSRTTGHDHSIGRLLSARSVGIGWQPRCQKI